MGELTVACVLRGGGEYNAQHVAGLQNQCRKYVPKARFVCLSDVPVPCERVPLESSWPGWWAKISLFDAFKGRTLYFDLDTLVVRDPAPMLNGKFQMIRNWKYRHLFASGVMAWDGDYSHIPRAFEPVAEQVMRDYKTCAQWGDQAFIAEKAGDVVGFSSADVVSWRWHCNRHGYPSEARVIAFAGKFRPWNCGAQWAQKWYPRAA